MISPETITTHSSDGRQRYQTLFYPAATRRGYTTDKEWVTVVAPGLLGHGALRFLATVLAHHGHDTAVVSHDPWRLLKPDMNRSRAVHLTARAACEATGKSSVVLLGYSHGNLDTHNAAIESLKRQERNPDNPNMYYIKAMLSAAGVGLNGRVPLQDFVRTEPRAARTIVREFMRNPKVESEVIGRSVLNFSKDPMLAVIEAIGATTCDLSEVAKRVRESSQLEAYTEVYYEDDNLVRRPADRDPNDYILLPGTHWTPTICPDAIAQLDDIICDPKRSKERLCLTNSDLTYAA